MNETRGPVPPEADPRIGRALAGYLLRRHVADGAMGRVYEGSPVDGAAPDGAARVAVKVLHPHVASDRVSVERFKREYETAQGFDHPHIVRAFDFGETGDGSWYLVMEYLEGEELGERLRREGAQPVAFAVRVASQVALALDYAHSFGVVHRDLKPDNVFLCRRPEGVHVKILDFGSVKLQLEMGPKLTAFGTTLGSPFYMSPEQAMGLSDVDPRTDVFALTAITYETIAGRVPFEGRSVAEILMAIVSRDPTPLSAVAPVPDRLDAVFEQGLRKDKAERFATAVAFANALATACGVSGGAQGAATASQGDTDGAVAAALSAAPAAAAPPTGRAAAAAPDPRRADARAAVDADSWTPPSARPAWLWPLLALVAVAAVGAAVYLLAS